ncbi:MAG: hypothetical protein UX10_C0006G0018 [Candidatus Magasanikbacteria bacterium GW2011_GWA2_45_39]|uniref:Methyltransferase domain-containing protein n=1 Tax=Candidatus Magasanikbacteria bacterium GW2011_GWA2_45_39 TaxID=1619041 RepID=A0A0G1MI48_9BACT|nr:MAG: hypothetical protein UX10_C0006G0018 [Candidatus Magasanikbacteria bacterium GW2011_GWA2_45_39]
MSGRYVYYKGDRDFMIASFGKYVNQKTEMDRLFEELVTPFIKDLPLQILDAGCGNGNLLHLLGEISPQSTFLGVDQTYFLIAEAKKLYGQEKNICFEVGDVENIPVQHHKAFDVAVSRATISWIPYYESFMKALVESAKKYIFVSSLFYEGDIDFITQVREFQKEGGRNGFSEYRNVYSLPRFKEYLFSLGAKNIEVYDFEIGIDIPKGPIDILGTYTVKMENGKRIQISGAVLMNWKWIRIDL